MSAFEADRFNHSRTSPRRENSWSADHFIRSALSGAQMRGPGYGPNEFGLTSGFELWIKVIGESAPGSGLLSLMPQSFHWVNFHGTTRRNVTGQHGDNGQQARNRNKSEWIRGSDPI